MRARRAFLFNQEANFVKISDFFKSEFAESWDFDTIDAKITTFSGILKSCVEIPQNIP